MTIQNKKKGFTLVELVIVIAVIGILAAILIPTFTNIIEKSKQSSDIQLVRNANTALLTEIADKDITEYDTIEEIITIMNETDFSITKIKAESSAIIVYDLKNSMFALVQNNATITLIYSPNDKTLSEVENIVVINATIPEGSGITQKYPTV